MNPVEKVAASEWFSKVGPKIVPHLDRFVHRITGGRVLLSGLYTPALVLTTTGRKSGEPRSVPLATFPHGNDLVVVGSNFGRENHPAWALNLTANPKASVSYKGKEFDVVARIAEGEERAELWEHIRKFMRQFDTYTERSGRELRVFVLERQPS
jgi:deazaflavin-dependent oxidoreductase (nitroreductase family)